MQYILTPYRLGRRMAGILSAMALSALLIQGVDAQVQVKRDSSPDALGPARSSLVSAALLAAAPPQAPGESNAPKLRIVILEGEGTVNNIKRRSAREPVVQIVDENDRPVGGAVVTFVLPGNGPSGVFANGAQSMTIVTDAQGTVTATGLTPNSIAGDMSIRVSASHQGQTATTTITQTNVAAAGAGLSTGATIGIIAAVAGAAAGVAIGLSGKKDSGPSPGPGPPIPTPNPTVRGQATVNLGGITVGAP